jgi:hypothetical protein
MTGVGQVKDHFLHHPGAGQAASGSGWRIFYPYAPKQQFFLRADLYPVAVKNL